MWIVSPDPDFGDVIEVTEEGHRKLRDLFRRDLRALDSYRHMVELAEAFNSLVKDGYFDVVNHDREDWIRLMDEAISNSHRLIKEVKNLNLFLGEEHGRQN